MTIVVSDTSVLCYLALTGRQPLLETLFTTITIPAAVLQECLHPRAPESLRRALSPVPEFVIAATADDLLPETAQLDPGEAAAITLTWRSRADSLLLLDEKKGRAVASALGLRLRRILGIVMESHRRALLDFDEAITQLRRHGFRIAEPLLAQARSALGLVG